MKYPAKTVKIHDITEDDEIALDEYFMDEDIQEMVEIAFDRNYLNESFFSDYPEEASFIYSGNYPSSWARNVLGFNK